MSHKLSQKAKRRLCIYGLFFGVIILILFINVISFASQIWSKNNEYKNLTGELITLKEEETKLKKEVMQLQLPDYVARYAREKYQYTKDDEIVYKNN